MCDADLVEEGDGGVSCAVEERAITMSIPSAAPCRITTTQAR